MPDDLPKLSLTHPLTVEIPGQSTNPGVLQLDGHDHLLVRDGDAIIAWLTARSAGLELALQTDSLILTSVIPWATAPSTSVAVGWTSTCDGSCCSIRVPPDSIEPVKSTSSSTSSEVRWVRLGILYSVQVIDVSGQAKGNGTILRPKREGPK